MLVCDGTRAAVRVGHSHAECALTKTGANEHGLPIPLALLAHERWDSRRGQSQSSSTFLAFSPDPGPLSRAQVVPLVTEIPGRPIGRLRNPLLWREEDRLHKNDATDLRKAASVAHVITLANCCEPGSELLEAPSAVALTETLPSKPLR